MGPSRSPGNFPSTPLDDRASIEVMNSDRTLVFFALLFLAALAAGCDAPFGAGQFWATMSALATVVLTAITGYYVWLTHKLFVHTRGTAERQQRLAFYPHLFALMSEKEGATTLTIRHDGTNPAYDVDVVLLAALSSEHLDVSEFISTHLKPDYRPEAAKRIPHKLVDDDFYSIRNRLLYSYFPVGWRVEIELPELPVDFVTYEAFIQFRDALGNNYGRVCWFFRDDVRWRLGSMLPAGDAFAPRVELIEGAEPLKNLPAYMNGFVAMLAASVPIGHTTLQDPYRGVEDPGEWSQSNR